MMQFRREKNDEKVKKLLLKRHEKRKKTESLRKSQTRRA